MRTAAAGGQLWMRQRVSGATVAKDSSGGEKQPDRAQNQVATLGQAEHADCIPNQHPDCR